MFNRKKIIELGWQIKGLEDSNVSQQKQIWQLRADLAILMAYLKLTFVDINERCVQAVISKPEEI